MQGNPRAPKGSLKISVCLTVHSSVADVVETATDRIKARAPSPEELAKVEAMRKAALESVDPQEGARAATISLNEDAFSLRVSRHLDDYRRGEGYLSKSVAGELYSRSGRTASLLAAEDPRAAARYNEYTTGFGYESRARFIQGVDSAATTASSIRQLQKRLDRIA
jgi:hypothetical protein